MRFILTILLFLSLTSQGQIINASAPYRPLSTPLLLDIYTGATAAYDMRKIRTAYSGNCIRVRRSSDNTESDIGFTSSGDLDTVTLKTFVGANNGFVVTWYDQAGSNNATQTTASRQPRIINAGVIERVGARPAIRLINSSQYQFDISPQLSFSGDFTWFTVTRKTSSEGFFSLIFVGGATLWGGDDVNNTGLPTYNGLISGSNTSASGGETSQHLAYYNRTGVASNGGNNGEVKTASGSTSNTITVNVLFGFTPFSINYTYDGHCQSIIMYPSNQGSNRSAIELNINTYYSIY
jgi:hypothetical protein